MHEFFIEEEKLEGLLQLASEKTGISKQELQEKLSGVMQDGKIVVDRQKCSSHKLQNYKFVKLPIIRGVVNFFDSMVLGMKSLMYSASLFAEETEEEKAEREGKARKKAQAKAEKLRTQGKTAEAEQVLAKCEEKLAKEAGAIAAEAEKEKKKKEK